MLCLHVTLIYLSDYKNCYFLYSMDAQLWMEGHAVHVIYVVFWMLLSEFQPCVILNCIELL